MKDKPDIQKLAKLSRIEITPEQAEIYSEQLEAIFDYVNTVNKIDTENITETIQLSMAKNQFRKDEPVECDSVTYENLKNIDNFTDNYFKVKKVI